jgi:protein-tyrosine phosphatase
MTSPEPDAPPERVIPLGGGHNFRDLGGYATADGRTLRWGMLFRSGTMADLTLADQALLAGFGIRLVCDLRANDERRERPTRWSEASPAEFWSRDHESSVGKLVRILSEGRPDATAARDFMIEVYRRLPYEQAKAYRELFLRAASGQLPLVFHCSAGKDRTGCAAALLLSALGVPRATIIEDYLLTERFFEQGCRLILADPLGRTLDQYPAEAWHPVIRAERAYIETMFATLEARHGSVDEYLATELRIDPPTLARLKENLLA